MSDILIEDGMGELPKVVLEAAGASADVYLYGAQVTSWKIPGGVEQLYLSNRAVYQQGKAIRGGVPISFPQFADFGNMLNHGFARTSLWELSQTSLDNDHASARFVLSDSPSTRAVWDFAFKATYTIMLSSSTLTLHLAIENTDQRPMTFTAALHTYFAVDDVRMALIGGLEGCSYIDRTNDHSLKTQDRQRLSIIGHTDRIYVNAPDMLSLSDGRGSREIWKSGFPDTVIWNIWEGASRLTDMEADDYLRYLCIEAAGAAAPISLNPGERWEGVQSARIN